MNNNKLKITFLGGVGEIGKNMTALEYNNEIVIIDAGLTFPGEELPGVDIVIPDMSYLIENKDKIKEKISFIDELNVKLVVIAESETILEIASLIKEVNV